MGVMTFFPPTSKYILLPFYITFRSVVFNSSACLLLCEVHQPNHHESHVHKQQITRRYQVLKSLQNTLVSNGMPSKSHTYFENIGNNKPMGKH